MCVHICIVFTYIQWLFTYFYASGLTRKTREAEELLVRVSSEFWVRRHKLEFWSKHLLSVTHSISLNLIKLIHKTAK